ncbi:Uncharacterized membrane protein YdjX, TVP38/TMEM64 family, SNARE-associated domain [Marinobacter persicus]|uniref:TVP38/TMEM64 family membrane protein n=1 Tax=Marinobacter persicus TaxID=930118 RepID=A0A1I3SU65_9GAMM|nr:VTT domain-containing protein [Marinobacter persicus]GHD41110.1 DedA family protein [Marinobacter persicus]SFJ61091.1 Uncharacterized membrane protein YdjX, TVP38/TMEM64 family, SNARE-associated domain [Marinobacter persicus]
MLLVVRSLGFALLALTGYVAVEHGWLELISDQVQLASYLNHNGLSGLIMVCLAGGLFTGIGGPRQLLAFALGFALGGVQGVVTSTLAAAIGATGCFWVARWLLRDVLSTRFGHRMHSFNKLFHEQSLLKILMVRLLPVGSNLLTNLVAGCSSIRFLPFLAGSTLGYLPQMLVFALAGAGMGQANRYQLAVSALLFILASVIGAYLYQKQRNQSLAQPVSDPS